MWLRCGIDEWHLDCRSGAELDLDKAVATPKSHDYIAAVKRKDGSRFELSIAPSFARVFDSNDALNDYLRALGLEEVGITPKTLR